MKVKITNTEDKTFVADNGKTTLTIVPQEMSPVEIFANAMLACSGVDVVQLSNKNSTPVKNLEIEADIKRVENFPQIFTKATFVFSFESDADDILAKRWVLSSLETYCTTINTIRATTKLYYTIMHNGETLAYKEYLLGSGNGAGSESLESMDDDLEDMGCLCCH